MRENRSIYKDFNINTAISKIKTNLKTLKVEDKNKDYLNKFNNLSPIIKERVIESVVFIQGHILKNTIEKKEDFYFHKIGKFKIKKTRELCLDYKYARMKELGYPEKDIPADIMEQLEIETNQIRRKFKIDKSETKKKLAIEDDFTFIPYVIDLKCEKSFFNKE
jgi:hypothetical protein